MRYPVLDVLPAYLLCMPGYSVKRNSFSGLTPFLLCHSRNT
jgi:hypothetical protein